MFKYQLGQFGFWKFTTKVKGKYGIEITHLSIEGATLTDQDARHVWLLGTDGVIYVPEKKRITEFRPMENKEV